MKLATAIMAGVVATMPATAEVLRTARTCDVPANLPPSPDIVESNSARTLAWLGPIYVEVQRRILGADRSGDKLRVGVLIDPATGETSLSSPDLRRDPATDPCD